MEMYYVISMKGENTIVPSYLKKIQIDDDAKAAEEACNNVIKLLKCYCRDQCISHIDFNAILEYLKANRKMRFGKTDIEIKKLTDEECEGLFIYPRAEEEAEHEDYLISLLKDWTRLVE